MNSPDGPLWFRGYSQWNDAEGEAEMPLLLTGAGVERFVVGHTVQKEARIRVRFDGAVFLIDTGMLDSTFFPGGKGSALEIADGVVSAIYAGEPRRVIWQPPREKAAAAAFAAMGERARASARRSERRRRNDVEHRSHGSSTSSGATEGAARCSSSISS